MAQTTAQNEKAIRFGSGVLKIDGTNVGLLDNANLAINFNMVQIRAHNGYLPVKKKLESIQFTAELYEVHLPIIQEIDSHGVLTNVAASPVNVTDEDLGTDLTDGTPVKIANANGNGTAVTSVSVTAGGSAFTDFEIFVQDGDSYLLPTANATGAILISYTYTPNASRKITFSDVAKLVSYYEVKFENTDENGKKFSITIPKGYASGNMALNFVSDDAVDETMKVPVELTAFPTATGEMLIIEDEQDA